MSLLCSPGSEAAACQGGTDRVLQHEPETTAALRRTVQQAKELQQHREYVGEKQ